MRRSKLHRSGLALAAALLASSAPAADPYVEPGALRLTHELILESVLTHSASDTRVEDTGVTKQFTPERGAGDLWRGDFGQRLLTEVATRVSPELSGRVLFEIQGEYADRFWRPNNIEHYLEEQDRHGVVREAEARFDRETWHVRGFAGVGRAGWTEQGDFFNLYPSAYPGDDYLGASSSFGIYPAPWRQDVFLNLSKRRAPRGFEAGASLYGVDAGLALGDELVWGFDNAVYGRLGTNLRSSRLTVVHKDENVPYSFDEDERLHATAVAWSLPFERGGAVTGGVLYQPFRVGETYRVARDAKPGEGIQGSATSISEKKANREDALAARLKWEQRSLVGNREILWSVDLTRAEVLAGNKQEADLRLGTNLRPAVWGGLQTTYRKPVEGPLPFLFEGTPDNVGNVVSNPRGPEAPFRVDWTNREAVLAVATLVFDPTPGTNFLVYDPATLQFWNVNPDENSRFAAGVQYRLSDYRTPIDRQYFYDAQGEIVFESAGRAGAPATRDPLHEFRFLGYGRMGAWGYGLGLAGGQSPALSGAASSRDASQSKALTEYYSIEAKFDFGPWAWWGHYGSGVWGPESYHRFFGASIDQLWGVGSSYAFTPQTRMDLSYLTVRQDRAVSARDIGAFDEVRLLLSHRFGFLFEFQEPARAGYRGT